MRYGIEGDSAGAMTIFQARWQRPKAIVSEYQTRTFNRKRINPFTVSQISVSVPFRSFNSRDELFTGELDAYTYRAGHTDTQSTRVRTE